MRNAIGLPMWSCPGCGTLVPLTWGHLCGDAIAQYAIKGVPFTVVSTAETQKSPATEAQ